MTQTKTATEESTKEQVQATVATSADVSAFSISPAEFLASRLDIHNLIAGAMVFRSTADSSSNTADLEVLMLQRAPSDSFPLQWEIPGGTADPTIDTSIIGVAVRELWEETQLRARRVLRAVGLGLSDGVANLTMAGDADDARMDSAMDLCLLRVSGLTWAIVTFITEVEDGGADVVLRPDEHVSWAWLDEDEVRKGKFRRERGESLDFVSEAMKMTVLEGFKLWKGMKQERR